MKHLSTILLLALLMVGSAMGQAKKITEYPVLADPLSGDDVVHMYEMQAAVGARSRQVTANQIKTFVLDGLETGMQNGVTTIIDGTSGYILYNNGGILSQKATTGSGSVVLANGGTLVSPTFSGGFTATGTILMNNATMALYSPTVNVSTPYASFAQEWDGEFVNFVGATSNIVGTNYDPDSALEEWKFNSTRMFAIKPDGTIESSGNINASGSTNVTGDGNFGGAVVADTGGTFGGDVLVNANFTADGEVSLGKFGGVWGVGSGSMTWKGMYGTTQWMQGGSGNWRLSAALGTGGGLLGIDSGGSAPVYLQNGDASHRLWLRDGSAAQMFAVANDFDDFTNYEALFIDAQTHTNEFWINSDNGSGGGTVRPMVLASNNVEHVRIADGYVAIQGNDGYGRAMSVRSIGGGTAFLSVSGDGTIFLSSGLYASQLWIGNPLNATESITLKHGTGTPESSVLGEVGDTYFNRTGSAGETLYVKESGTATTTGWQAMRSASKPWLVKTTAYTAVSWDAIQTDTSGAAFAITLPASPTIGDCIYIEDATGSWPTNNLTIARNGLKINGATSNYTGSVLGSKLTCVYISVAYGWSIK